MYRALIIDDEKPVQIAIQKLGHWKYYNMDPPQLAVNGKNGLSAMQEFHPDIVFVDMNMPAMDGASFLMKASQEFPDSQYIVVSGYNQFSYAQQAIRYGVCEYLLKPVVEEELNAAIEKALLRIDPEASFQQAKDTREEISPEEAVRIIKEYIDNKYGFTIYEYVLKLRMERAKELLEDENNKIIDIAERLGYADNHYFSKAFRTYYNISPSQYRKEFQEKK